MPNGALTFPWKTCRKSPFSRSARQSGGVGIDEVAFLLGHREANVIRAVYVRELRGGPSAAAPAPHSWKRDGSLSRPDRARSGPRQGREALRVRAKPGLDPRRPAPARS